VVEYCDLGNLTSAIRSQIFNLPAAGASRHSHTHSRHASRSSRHSGYESGGYDSSTDEGSCGADSGLSSPSGAVPGAHVSGGNAVPPGHLRVNMRWLLLTLLEVAEGMAYLHRMGVVHCDLKPANVSTARQMLGPRLMLPNVCSLETQHQDIVQDVGACIRCRCAGALCRRHCLCSCNGYSLSCQSSLYPRACYSPPCALCVCRPCRRCC
jgi:serine/threonine protein kinase